MKIILPILVGALMAVAGTANAATCQGQGHINYTKTESNGVMTVQLSNNFRYYSYTTTNITMINRLLAAQAGRLKITIIGYTTGTCPTNAPGFAGDITRLYVYGMAR